MIVQNAKLSNGRIIVLKCVPSWDAFPMSGHYSVGSMGAALSAMRIISASDTTDGSYSIT